MQKTELEYKSLYDELFHASKQCRQAQQNFYHSRKNGHTLKIRQDLESAKEKERSLDKLIERHTEVLKQEKLF